MPPATSSLPDAVCMINFMPDQQVKLPRSADWLRIFDRTQLVPSPWKGDNTRLMLRLIQTAVLSCRELSCFGLAFKVWASQNCECASSNQGRSRVYFTVLATGTRFRTKQPSQTCRGAPLVVDPMGQKALHKSLSLGCS